MREYVTEEGYRYRIDAAGRTLLLRTNHPRELADALEVLARELSRTRQDLHAWKWAVIAAHNALQNILADCAAHEREKPARTRERRQFDKAVAAFRAAATDGEQSEALDNVTTMLLDIVRDGRRLEDLRTVIELFDAVAQGLRDKPSDYLRERVVVLNRVRNEFVHFGVTEYEISVGDYPYLISDCISWVEHLGWHTGLVMWLDTETQPRARRALDDCLRLLGELRTEYDAD